MKKFAICLAVIIITAVIVGFCMTASADPACTTCAIRYWYEDGYCWIGGNNCLPNQTEGGQYYIVYRPESLNWGQYMLDQASLICQEGCNGYTFKARVACKEYVDYYFVFILDGGGEYRYCEGSRAYYIQ
jgi:hypothetical protein